MDNLNTYNQVRQLGTVRPRRWHYALFGLAGLIFITSLVCRILGIASLAALALATVASTLIIAGTVSGMRLTPQRCRRCGNTLSAIVRPFTFSEQYLSMQGLKDGDFFYTCAPASPLSGNARGYLRISKQSPACHHCRLILQGHRTVTETVTEPLWQEVMARHPNNPFSTGNPY